MKEIFNFAIADDANGGVAQIRDGKKLCHKPGERGQRLGGARGDMEAKVPYLQLQSSTNNILDITTLKNNQNCFSLTSCKLQDHCSYVTGYPEFDVFYWLHEYS
jgi:hypothetical protein